MIIEISDIQRPSSIKQLIQSMQNESDYLRVWDWGEKIPSPAVFHDPSVIYYII